ncbi:hypothetical protein EJ05DRAFT_478076 [Pseudovirgaria hyperparasitica]|uniref:Uncharacterized protein n=1 Tax=Pseudovirgaria hyperparasitica TaxID=470096 RepID=A0A6A6W4Q1_9PEZI|nr:uncharacterized protein EJ05DRAFT_478076 [Pseudovirgaria hyperparasitica]KAF2756031.1 hypothetical protein EJ05DRAFT_478076 [Pseudovirgaria hyperparasitica]
MEVDLEGGQRRELEMEVEVEQEVERPQLMLEQAPNGNGNGGAGAGIISSSTLAALKGYQIGSGRKSATAAATASSTGGPLVAYGSDSDD